MRIFTLACILILLTIWFPLHAGEEFCGAQNTSFLPNEQLTYKVYYRLANVYIGAGEAVFHTSLDQLNNRIVYHIVGDGTTYSFYDNFFKVRDRYETFIDTTTMQPLKFVRNINEGGYKKYENVTFNKATNTA